jgi:hypothetical protein
MIFKLTLLIQYLLTYEAEVQRVYLSKSDMALDREKIPEIKWQKSEYKYISALYLINPPLKQPSGLTSE